MNNSNIDQLNSKNNQNKKTLFENFLESLNNKLAYSTKNTINIAQSAVEAITNNNLQILYEITENGLPDDLPILRAYVWKIIIGYLPIDLEKWDQTLNQKRNEYQIYKKLIKEKLEKEIEQKDYKSKETLEQIIKDVYRTNIQLSFFFQPTNKLKTFNKEEMVKIYEKRKNWDFSRIEDIYKYDDFENETHTDVLNRILFTYSYINKDVSYHQGMNEILAPIYYCYSYDKLYVEEKEEDIEADSFWSFYYLMDRIKSNFDKEQEGLFFKSELLGKCLEICDNTIFLDLKNKNVANEYFCFRWFIMLFSQEFEIGDILKLWDLIFCRKNKNYFLFYISLGIINIRRDIILKGGMAEILQCFQNLKDISCDDLIFVSREIKNKWKNKLDSIIVQSEKEY